MGSYSSMKSPYMYWSVSADFPTPPDPTMMTLWRGRSLRLGCFFPIVGLEGGVLRVGKWTVL